MKHTDMAPLGAIVNGGNISKGECELRCGAYKKEVATIADELRRIDSKQVDCARWQAEHDGRINAWWEQQFRTNKDFSTRLRSIESKVFWFAGFAACGGTVIGHLITKYLGG